MENKNLDELIVYDVNMAAIAELKQKYLALTVKGLDDKEGYLECKEARLEVKNVRVAIEKKRKELKEDSLTFGKKVDTRAKELSKPLEEIEAHLQAQQDVIDKEVQRQKEIAEQSRRDRLKSRVDKLFVVRAYVDLTLLNDMSDEEFDVRLKTATDEYTRKVEEEEKARARQLEVDAENKRLAEEKAKQDAEIKRLNDEALARERAEVERLRKEAADKEAKIQEENRLKSLKESAELVEKQRIDKQKKEAEEAEMRRAAAEKEHAARTKAAEEAEAQRKVANEALFNYVKTTFPTVELAWVELARLISTYEPE